MDDDLQQAARVIEFDRAQIGHEIHDALLPLIFAASAAVGSVIDRHAPHPDADALSGGDLDRLRQASKLLDDAMQTGRRLLTSIYPPELNETGWTTVARQTIERLLGTAGQESTSNNPIGASTVRWDVDPQADALDPNAAVAAYRILVEAVRNAVRHASPHQVTVEIKKSSHQWQICVTDDGVGFDPQQTPSDRFGIRSMRARATLVGGEFEIDSQPGGPTRVCLRIPADGPDCPPQKGSSRS